MGKGLKYLIDKRIDIICTEIMVNENIHRKTIIIEG